MDLMTIRFKVQKYLRCLLIERNNFVFDDLALSCTESMIRVKVGLNGSHD